MRFLRCTNGKHGFEILFVLDSIYKNSYQHTVIECFEAAVFVWEFIGGRHQETHRYALNIAAIFEGFLVDNR
ncbi:Uncharacterised protein [Vibrio cholerae]|nr:Uncharacterised protein [Vibrio cholerae]